MSLDINTVLGNISKTYTGPKTSSANTSTNANVNSESIFAKASELVSAFKEEQNSNTSSSGSKSGLMSGLNYSQVASMSTSDFLNYAYNNKANSGFKESSNDSSGIELPILVRYKTQVVSTAGKSFMQVVAKLAAKFPHRTEEEIAAELMTKYGKFDENGNLITNNETSSTGTTSTTSTTANPTTNTSVSSNNSVHRAHKLDLSA